MGTKETDGSETNISNSEKDESFEVPISIALSVSHHKQKDNWDCGIACVLMVLPLEQRQELVHNFNTVCIEEGFNKSTWTIDLCYLLQRYRVKHCYCTITLGIHPGYENQSFYARVLEKDEARVTLRFKEAEKNGIEVRKASLKCLDLVYHLARHGPIILLTNSSLLFCDICKSKKLLAELKNWIPWGVGYNGHYIVLCGYSLSKRKFLYRNPSFHDRICCMSFSAMDEARLSYGTDEDAILIFSNKDCSAKDANDEIGVHSGSDISIVNATSDESALSDQREMRDRTCSRETVETGSSEMEYFGVSEGNGRFVMDDRVSQSTFEDGGDMKHEMCESAELTVNPALEPYVATIVNETDKEEMKECEEDVLY